MSLHAEQKIIGSLLIEPDCISQICTTLEPEMFTNEFLAVIYAEYLKGYENQYEVNEIVLEQRVVSDSFPQEVFQKELSACLELSITRATLKTEADVIVKDYKAKKLSELLNRTVAEPGRIYEQIGGLITKLEMLLQGKEVKSLSVSDMPDKFQEHYFCDESSQGIRTGFTNLDAMIGDLIGGDVIVIGARPSVGKSAFVTQIAMNLAKQGKRVGFYNLEMQERQMYERFIVAESGISLQRLKRALSFQNSEKEKFDKANKFLKEGCKNLIINTGATSMTEIRAESRHMKYDIIIIDYMQLITPETSYRGNRAAEVGEISRKIKNLAMELNIPIIALSQLNRVSEARETREPTMAELRESGNVEQDASIILLMWNMNEERTEKGLKADKNRQGIIGKVKLTFNGEIMKFVESEKSDKGEPDDDNPFV